MAPNVLVTGSAGQIGAELVPRLRSLYGKDNVVAAVHASPRDPSVSDGPMVVLDTGDQAAVVAALKEYKVDTVYHLAALLSAKGEKDPQLAWTVNMDGLRNVLEASRTNGVSQVFWPSSIGAFGPDAPKTNTPQNAPLNPTTMYGVTKVAGELLCNYYHAKYGLDVRCLRYPGLISSVALPGGGTTDYAVEIFYEAVRTGSYTCFLREDTVLPMMYMPDALKATVQLMEAPAPKVPRHLGYNLAAFSFSAGELASEVAKLVPGFKVTYSPDSRQKIADSWPQSIDDKEARRDWGWEPEYDLARMVADMLAKLRLRREGKGV
ncbi:MAG: NAD-dependent epimerase/dehydratase family protein [Nitrososphaerota archaeon]|nr:NAD-dependent epimerase/dehydratase family protein [Nitrososphaerota archaeon]MDG7013590.1 NAD-dependent epimerase/dehydratase family protein [Nitrososphaerota archaeon]MDG7025860.1 NAD-dependent epimerase/dehydratase family protein [Nitrososphaerota archaeon]